MRSSTTGHAQNSKAFASTRAARAHLREAADDTRDGVREMGAAAKDVARTELERLQEQAAILRDEMLVKIADKPLKSLLIAAGAGVVVGLLLRRR